MAIKYSNNAKTTLTSAITDAETSITVADASVFPVLGAGDTMYLTLSDAANQTTEITLCTDITGNVLTVQRGYENTTALAWGSGDVASSRLTAGMLEQLMSASGGGIVPTYQNSAYTASVGDMVLADTSSATFAVTLPATPSENDTLFITDYANTFSANGLQVVKNGSTIEDNAADIELSFANREYMFIYLNSSWRVFSKESLQGVITERYLIGPTSGNEGTTLEFQIAGWSVGDTYNITIPDGAYSHDNGYIAWTLPFVSSSQIMSMSLELIGGGTYNHDVYIVNVPTSTDTSISITDFSINSSSIGWII